ncbi:MAG TPA: DoxX family protein [Microvirga sp.]|jgi:hypothetical protein|nr:DoxX family protein [Microvirga sp.]
MISTLTIDAGRMAAPLSRRAALWTGRAMSGLVVAFFLIDGGIKLVPLQPVIDTMADLGWPTDAGTLRLLGVVMLVATALYAHPRTALLGAIVMTGYLGGAMATHARIGSPAFTHLLFGLYVGIAAWAGLWLREPRLRALLPILLTTKGNDP